MSEQLKDDNINTYPELQTEQAELLKQLLQFKASVEHGIHSPKLVILK